MLIAFPPRKLIATDNGVRIVFTREEVRHGDAHNSEMSLAPLVASSRTVSDYEGLLSFEFRGFEDGNLVPVEIPEIREFFTRLTNSFPYWLHFCERSVDMSQQILGLLTPVTVMHRIADQSLSVEINSRYATEEGNRLVRRTVQLYRTLGIPRVKQMRMVEEMQRYINLGIN